jgi:hypothetical protein
VLPIEIYNIFKNITFADFRKKSLKDKLPSDIAFSDPGGPPSG